MLGAVLPPRSARDQRLPQNLLEAIDFDNELHLLLEAIGLHGVGERGEGRWERG